MYGVDEFSAIINPPQCSILAVGGSRLVLGKKQKYHIFPNTRQERFQNSSSEKWEMHKVQNAMCRQFPEYLRLKGVTNTSYRHRHYANITLRYIVCRCIKG
jgi:hypothetical protein